MKIFKKAFTLVEMLIVVIIIGILMSALLPRLTDAQVRARNDNRIYLTKQIQIAMEEYIRDRQPGEIKLENGVYCSDGEKFSKLLIPSYLGGKVYDLQQHKNYYAGSGYCKGSFPMVVTTSGINIISTMELVSNNVEYARNEINRILEKAKRTKGKVYYLSFTGLTIPVNENGDNINKIINLVENKKGVLNYAYTIILENGIKTSKKESEQVKQGQKQETKTEEQKADSCSCDCSKCCDKQQ